MSNQEKIELILDIRKIALKLKDEFGIDNISDWGVETKNIIEKLLDTMETT